MVDTLSHTLFQPLSVVFFAAGNFRKEDGSEGGVSAGALGLVYMETMW